MTRPVVVAVSQATRAFGSSRMIASRIASLIWSHILSGWPSVTDSDVNRYCGGVDDAHAASGASSSRVERRAERTTGLAEPASLRRPVRTDLEIEVSLDPTQRLVADRRRRRAAG